MFKLNKAVFLSARGDMNVVKDFDEVEELFLRTSNPDDYELLEFVDDGDKSYVIYGNDSVEIEGQQQSLLTGYVWGDIIVVCIENNKLVPFDYADFMDCYIELLDEHEIEYPETFYLETRRAQSEKYSLLDKSYTPYVKYILNKLN